MNKSQNSKSHKRSVLEVSNIPQMAQIPSGVEAEAYAKARTAEILLMKQELEEGKFRGTKRVFQTLPRNMRRRAASHNIHRLPIRLRERALAEINKDPSSAPKEVKKPSCRRRRRRTTNIVKEFGRRQQSKTWLSTHMWHSKRCRMEDLWGYRLAIKGNEKCRKSCIRASQEDIFLYDTSYWEIFHFSTSLLEEYIEAGSKLFHKNASSLFKLSGINSMNSSVMKSDGKILCPSLLVSYSGNDDGETTYSFIFTIHPSVTSVLSDIHMKDPLLKLNMKHIKRKYCMFEMEGRRCDELLQEKFLYSDEGGPQSTNIKMHQIIDLRFFNQSSVSSPSQLFPISWNEFWNHNELSSRFSFRKSPQQINECRSKLLPGSSLIPSSVEDPPIPLMFIKLGTTGNHDKPFPRYMLISLSEWGMDIWRTLAHSKVRIGAMAEYEAVQLEKSRPVFPRDYSICKEAFSHFSSEYFGKLKTEWERKPPAKRINYQSLNMPDPFTLCLSLEEDFVLCLVEMDKKSVPEWNSRIYIDGKLAGFITSGCYSQLKGRGVGIASILTNAVDSSPCPISVLVQLPSSITQRPATITKFIYQ